MPYAVDSAWGISCWITPISWNRLGPESKELAAAGPMKCSRTRRVCTLGMLFLIERSALQVLTTRRGLFIVSRSKSQPLFFQYPNRRLQPLFRRFFNFCLIAVAIERIQRFSGVVQWNMEEGNPRKCIAASKESSASGHSRRLSETGVQILELPKDRVRLSAYCTSYPS